MKRVALVSCSAIKAAQTEKARDLYRSPLFKKALAYAERHFDEVRILSAKHGVVHPDERIDPYDQKLDRASDVVAWGLRVRSALLAEFPPPAEFTLFAGQLYAGWAGKAVALIAVVSGLGALNGWTLVTAEMPFAAARDGMFPRAFAKVDAKGTPWFGVIVSTIVASVLMAWSYSGETGLKVFTYLVYLSVVTVAIPYFFSACAQLSYLISRRRKVEGWRLARDIAISVASMLFALWVTMASGYQSVYQTMLLVLVGLPIYAFLKARRERDGLVRVDAPQPVVTHHHRGHQAGEGSGRHRGVEGDTVEAAGLRDEQRVVIGEGERDEAPMLYIGEKVGSAPGKGPKIDIAVDPLEGTTITAKAGPNALAVLAIAEEGCLLNAPDVYMDKLAVGPGYPEGIIDLAKSPTENVKAVAAAKGVSPGDIIVCVLDRPRHAELIAAGSLQPAADLAATAVGDAALGADAALAIALAIYAVAFGKKLVEFALQVMVLTETNLIFRIFRG